MNPPAAPGTPPSSGQGFGIVRLIDSGVQVAHSLAIETSNTSQMRGGVVEVRRQRHL